jgi:CDP-diacylglycerol--glycerol-3-phosphate 3-phosphatidyltransferase
MLDGKFRAPVDRVVRPLGAMLRRTGISADQLTVLGLGLGFGAGAAIATGRFLLGLILVVLAGLPDLLDGALAKASDSSSQRGAFFDSTVDRITDAALFGGLVWYFAAGTTPLLAMLPFAVASVAQLISYQRAKAESLGLDAKGGLMERAERVVLLCVGLAFPVILIPVLWLMLALSAVTALQRFVKIWRQAEVAPVIQERIDLRRSRRQSRRIARAQRRRVRVPRRRL